MKKSVLRTNFQENSWSPLFYNMYVYSSDYDYVSVFYDPHNSTY